MSSATRAIPSSLADLPNVTSPLPGLVTAGMPKPDHFKKLAAAGFTTVLDICAPEEARGFDETTSVAAAGLTYINIPVRSSTPPDEVFDQVRATLRATDQRPLFFHCRSANRVGGLLLTYLLLDEGRSSAEALALASQVGLRNPDLLQTALAYVARHQAAPATITE